jgi:hypothetical protein
MKRIMPRKSTAKPKSKPSASRSKSDPAQYKRFLETAREVGADESKEAFERAFKRVAKPAKR